jgi:hypothetical protein
MTITRRFLRTFPRIFRFLFATIDLPRTEQMATCNCSIGSSFNMRCSDACKQGRVACLQTEDGCGFLGWYSCNGGCTE